MNGGVSDYVVAIDLGSSKIVGSLGKKRRMEKSAF